MEVRSLQLGLLLAALALVLMACAQEAPASERPDLQAEIPPCTPAEGSDVDPCDPNRERGGNPLAHGSAGDEPRSMRSYLDGGSDISVSHMVIRATFLPGTTRCVGVEDTRVPPYTGLEGAFSTSVVCFTDVRVNDYVVGNGPPKLTVVTASLFQAGSELEQGARNMERILVNGGIGGRFRVPEGGIEGNEMMMFVGPARTFNFEALRAIGRWDVQRRDGGQVVAVHPHAEYWLWKDADTYRSRVERSLPDFGLAVGSAAQERTNDNDGRIRPGSSYPSLVQDANRLHNYYVETGAMTHATGPPAPPPPACGIAVSDYLDNPGLVSDCETLLALKDTLRGTGTLNWSVDVAMTDWDGVTVAGTPQCVTKLELANRSLTGSIPTALARLELTTLKLAGNTLTGCIAPALRDVATNDLDALGLRDCG